MMGGAWQVLCTSLIPPIRRMGVRLATVIMDSGEEYHGVVLVWANMVPDGDASGEVELSFERMSNGDIYFIRANKIASITWTDHR